MSGLSRHTESQPEMEFVDFIICADICVCLVLTTLVIFWVFCLVKREQAPLIYYINLLTSNLIQFIMILFLKHGQKDRIIFVIDIVGVMAGVYFRMIIAMERCFVITRPQWNWIRQTGKSLLVSVLVWILCITTVSLSIHFLSAPLFVVALLPAPLFIFFSAWTFKALPAATSVPTDEKRRIVGPLVLLLINYFLMILPIIICLIATVLRISDIVHVVINIIFVLFLLSPYADLILAFFIQKGPIDKLLSCLCSITDSTAEDVAEYQQLHELMLQRQRERGKGNQIV